MKKIVILLLIALSFLLSAQSQEEEPQTEPLKEYVSVTNVELILKVVQDGRTLGGFKKGDFKLLEDGRECPINGFFELKKTMKAPANQEKLSTPLPGRLFVLLIWASQSQSEIDRHLDHFFKDVYTPQDRVILASNDLHMEITHPEQISKTREEFRRMLSQEILKKENHWRVLYRDLSFEIDQMIRVIRLNKNGGEVYRFLNNFKTKYDQYIKEIEFMTQHVNFKQMETMSEDLRKLNTAKWAMVFFEPPRIPMLDIMQLKSEVENVIVCDDDGTMVGNWFRELTLIDMRLSQQSNRFGLYEKLRTRFTQSDTVFHFLLMDTVTSIEIGKADETPFITYKPVASNWETILKGVSQNTGGMIGKIDTDPSVLSPLFEQEDISYLLTYVPRNSQKRDRKIQVVFSSPQPVLNNRNLLYGKRLELTTTPRIRIEAVEHIHDTLHLTCSSYHPVYTAMGPRGQFRVHVKGKGPEMEFTDLFKGEIEYAGPVDIPLPLTKSGKWTLIIEIIDAMTELHDRKEIALTHVIQAELKPDEAPSDDKPLLGDILAKSAQYCKKLQKTAIRFFCQERVTEKIANPTKTFHFKKWQYDYQIVLVNGKLIETRTDIRKRKKDKPQAASLQTLYTSHYSFFLPVTFLNQDRQKEYIYSLIDRNSLQKRPTIHIMATPKQIESGLPRGELWIDEADGSVLQISLDPKTIKGFDNRYKLAEENFKVANITDTHEYFQVYNMMRFPTSTFITEHQNPVNRTNPPPNLNRYEDRKMRNDTTFYTVHFQYDDFRFFDVDAQEEVVGWIEEDKTK